MMPSASRRTSTARWSFGVISWETSAVEMSAAISRSSMHGRDGMATTGGQGCDAFGGAVSQQPGGGRITGARADHGE